MAASDNLQPQQFFHGTVHEFKPGEMIEPAAKIGHPTNWSASDANYTHATPNLWEAAEFVPTHRLEDDRPGRVYQVEPVGHLEPDPHSPQTQVRSSTGFRVTREVPGPEWMQARNQARAEYTAKVKAFVAKRDASRGFK